MAISNLSAQYISQSFQSLVQVDTTNGKLYSGTGAEITTLATTSSRLSTLQQNVQISGSLYVTSSAVTLGQFTGNQNGYVEFSVRNISTGVSASGDIAVYADTGTVSSSYIDMGIHNSGATGSYSYFGTDFGNALDAYVYNVGGNLRIGNATSTAPFSQSFHLFSNPTATPNITISGSQVGINKSTGLNAAFDVNGNTIISGSLIQAAITLPATLVTGSSEFDGSLFYLTSDSSGRSLNANHHLFYLPTSITHSVAAGTIVDVFSGSLHAFTMQPNSLYEVTYNIFYTLIGAASSRIFTIDGGAQSWQNINVSVERSGLAGGTSIITGSIGATGGGLSPLYITHINASNLQTLALNTGIDAINSNQRTIIKALIYSNATTPSILRLRHSYSGGTGTIIWASSYYTIKKMPAISAGVFTAPAVPVG